MFVAIAVPVPFLPLLTYHVPAGLPAPPRGARVLVPLGTRQVTGCVVAPADPPDDDVAVRDIVRTLDDVPFVPEDVVDLAQWVAEYYGAGPGEALGAAMPPGAWIETERIFGLTDAGRAALADSSLPTPTARLLEALSQGPASLRRLQEGGGGESLDRVVRSLLSDGLVHSSHDAPRRVHAFRTVRVAALTVLGQDVAQVAAVSNDPAGATGLTARQIEALVVLAGSGRGQDLASLRQRGITADIVRRLAARGLVRMRDARRERDPFAASAAPVATVAGEEPGQRALTTEQADAMRELEDLVRAGEFRVALLHGVTGSGKTELYVRVARLVRDTGRRVLVLVPEIALTPAVAAVFRTAFGSRVAIQHSGLSDGERHDQWHRIRAGQVDIVVGTRSAVFAPIEDIGLIIVDEEHDSSYKQEETPRYNGRDVAVVRGRQSRALVVLGSATPSMESYRNALEGRYSLVRLQHRVLGRPLADVTVVNMRDEIADQGGEAVLSRQLASSLDACIGRGEQALLLLNRRGFARAVFCRQCGDTFDCPNCSVSLTVHHGAKGPGRGRCHYCNYSTAVPKTCANCAGPYLEQVGIGTERVEAEVRSRLPHVRVARVDRDTMQRRGAIQGVLSRFGAGAIDVIVGTQMIAKGHDFPAVTLVGVISADVGLGLPDFRASERTFQLLTQVAGRAGRGTLPGHAIIQTLFPEHYSIQLACRQEYAAFYEREIGFRRAMRYPPAVALVNIVVRAPAFGRAMNEAGDLAARIRSEAGTADVRVLGPAPAPLGKLRGEYRAQLLVKGVSRPAIREAAMRAVAAVPDLQRRTTVDVDPLSMM
jgi:primosomal protein N' (replication factor Y)